uniref:Uncharacterized protein n=1 Tax=Rhipicephalus zambeziensis TaxID=60191 RepID=A0A224Y5Z6_9ACAR
MATLTAVHLPVANSAHTFQERVPLGDALWGEFGTDEAALEEGVGRCLLSEVARLHLLAVNAPVEAATHPQPRHGCLLQQQLVVCFKLGLPSKWVSRTSEKLE